MYSTLHCPTRCFGTEKSDFDASPILLSSWDAAIMRKVFPAPTQCQSREFPPNTTLAAPSF